MKIQVKTKNGLLRKLRHWSGWSDDATIYHFVSLTELSNVSAMSDDVFDILIYTFLQGIKIEIVQKIEHFYSMTGIKGPNPFLSHFLI